MRDGKRGEADNTGEREIGETINAREREDRSSTREREI